MRLRQVKRQLWKSLRHRLTSYLKKKKKVKTPKSQETKKWQLRSWRILLASSCCQQTVLIDKLEYLEKLANLIRDSSKFNKDPPLKIERKLSLIITLINSYWMNKDKWFSVIVSDNIFRVSLKFTKTILHLSLSSVARAWHANYWTNPL